MNLFNYINLKKSLASVLNVFPYKKREFYKKGEKVKFFITEQTNQELKMVFL